MHDLPRFTVKVFSKCVPNHMPQWFYPSTEGEGMAYWADTHAELHEAINKLKKRFYFVQNAHIITREKYFYEVGHPDEDCPKPEMYLEQIPKLIRDLVRHLDD